MEGILTVFSLVSIARKGFRRSVKGGPANDKKAQDKRKYKGQKAYLLLVKCVGFGVVFGL
jgi:hypothetical protein